MKIYNEIMDYIYLHSIQGFIPDFISLTPEELIELRHEINQIKTFNPNFDWKDNVYNFHGIPIKIIKLN